MLKISSVGKKITSFLVLIGSDYLSFLVSLSLAFLIRNEIMPLLFPSIKSRVIFFSIYLQYSFMFLVWIAVFLLLKLYTKRYSFWDEVKALLKGNTISFALVMIAVFISQQYRIFSRAVILLAWIISLLVFPFIRYLSKRILFWANIWKKNVVVIAPEDSLAVIVKKIRQEKNLGYEVAGCLTPEPPLEKDSIYGAKILGQMKELSNWKPQLGFEDVVVYLPDMPKDKLVALLKLWDSWVETIRYVPPIGDIFSTPSPASLLFVKI